jgi:hypothetical protein
MNSRMTTGVRWPNGKAYFFLPGGLYGRYLRWDIATTRMDDGYPKSIKGNWAGLWPASPDAAFLEDHTTAYFFKGSECIKVDVESKKAVSGYPKPIKADWHGIWNSDIDAAWAPGNTGTVYFFKGEQYAEVSLANHTITSDGMKPLKRWDGNWNSDIDAVVDWLPGQTLFFKGEEVIIVVNQAGAGSKVFPPKSIAHEWPGLLPRWSSRTSFEPQIHSFKFPNSFKIKGPFFGQKTWTMGLCGGMCFGALDRVRNGRSLPPNTEPPKEDCPELELFWELIKRQAVTLFPTAWARVLLFQAMPDEAPFDILDAHRIEPGLGPQTRKNEWPNLKQSLDNNHSRIVCLIQAAGFDDPTQNHQVVAMGYEWFYPDDLRILIYDPNAPLEVSIIKFDPSGGGGLHGKLISTDSHGLAMDPNPVRGFFAIDDPDSMFK